MACVEELDGWMASNRLKLNAAKTQVMWVAALPSWLVSSWRKSWVLRLPWRGTASFRQPVLCASVFTLIPSWHVESSGAMFSPSPPTVDDSMRTVRRQRENASPLSYYAALLPRRGPHIASHSVCPSVCPSVPLSSVTSRHLANYNDTLRAAYRTAISAAQTCFQLCGLLQ